VYEFGADEKKEGVELGWDAGHNHTTLCPLMELSYGAVSPHQQVKSNAMLCSWGL
jgi:hypothetical protein